MSDETKPLVAHPPTFREYTPEEKRRLLDEKRRPTVQPAQGVAPEPVEGTTAHRLLAWKRRAESAERALADSRAEVERLREALTPSGETKAAYIGEFSFEIGDDGEAATVPWSAVKDIMRAILARAALAPKEEGHE